jgi:DNA-binding IscR family transcriptional regulator
MPAEEVLLLKVFEVIEGPLAQGGCLLREPVCPGNTCKLGNLICSLQEQIHDFLANTTVAEFSRDLAVSSVSADPRGTATRIRGVPRRKSAEYRDAAQRSAAT